MNTDPSRLPKEVAALVHHIELNRSGWWEKVIQRLALAAVWWSDHPPRIDEIRHTLSREFKLSLTVDKVRGVLSALEKQNLLVELPDAQYRIPDAQRLVFEQDIEAAERVESDAREFFYELAKGKLASIDPPSLWGAFQADLLTPLVKEAGATAYRLIAGESLSADENVVDHFLKPFDPSLHSVLRELVANFLDPKKGEVRAYVSRMLHARFCVDASGLPEDAIQKLNASIKRPVLFRIFVDTNFLFSLLELHENPSNIAARELLDVISQLKSNPKVRLFIVPRTIEEAKTSIGSAKQRLSGIPAGSNFTQAALNTRVSGMAEKFLSERLRRGGKLTVEDWFDPYLGNFVALARGKGVEFFNESLDSYSQRQDVVDDILYVLEFEKRFDMSRRKSYQIVAHDMILWHFVKDNRPVYIESPIDARDWILTLDFRLIGFDEYKQRISGSPIPVCLHPSTLIQLLQFWVPRTKDFEEAMLGSLRLPFLFQKFDIEAERTSLRILKGLGRFERRDDISAETITSVVLNDGLRARLQSEQSENGETETALIRDALLDEMNTRTAAVAENAQRLLNDLTQKNAALGEMDARERSQADEVKRLSARVLEEEARAKKALADLQAALARTEEAKKGRRTLFLYCGLLALVLLVSGVAAWHADRLLPDWAKMIGSMPMKILAASVVFVAGHFLLEWSNALNGRMRELWPFVQVRKFRVWLWGLVILGFLIGVSSGLYVNWIQKHIDQEIAVAPTRK